MRIRQTVYAVVVLAASLVASNASSVVVPPLTYTPTQSETLVDVISKLHSRHYRDQRFDDELSARFLDGYIDSLDPARMFFYEKDIAGFRKNATKFDDFFKSGDLEAGYEIYSIYRQRVISHLEFSLEAVRDKKIDFAFTTDDELLLDREELPWPSTRAEAEDIWFKRVKLSLLNLKLAGKTLDEARETVEKRFKNQLNRIQQQNSTDVFETLVNALTLLYDPHTNYWSPRTSENFNINMSLSLEGIGAVLQSEDEFTKVVRLVTGGPAEKQGQLKPTDRIVGVAQGDDGEVIDVIGWRLDEVVQLIRGPKDTVVKLEVLPADAVEGATKVVKIARARVKLEDQAAQKAVFELATEEKRYKIGVINLPTFYIDFEAYNNRDPNYKSSTRDVERLLGELQKENVDGVILDLRNNGGGSLREATQLTDLFIDQGPVVQIRSPDGRVARHNRSLKKAAYRGPLIVMVNRLSASASEIFAGAIQDYGRGLIVGSQSFGKGTVQSVTPLKEGRLKLTESKFYRVSGDSTQHRGVIPDIAMPILIDTDEVGESAYDNALPWDKIHAVNHDSYFSIASMIPHLKALHDKRATTDPDFRYLLDQVALMEKNKDKKTVSLNEKTRLAEKEEVEKLAVQIENKRRVAKSLKPYTSLEEYREAEKEEEEAEADAASRQVIQVDGDVLLQETGHIMVDFIHLLNQPDTQTASNF